MLTLSIIQGPTRCGNCTNLLDSGQCLDGIFSSTITNDITVGLSTTTTVIVPISATPTITNLEGLGRFNNCILTVTNYSVTILYTIALTSISLIITPLSVTAIPTITNYN